MTTTPDFRTQCAELLAAIQLYTGLNPAASEMSSVEITEKLMEAMAATVAALAAPPPEPPLDEEILELAGDAWISFAKSQPNPQRYSWDLVLIRAALERWGDAYPTR